MEKSLALMQHLELPYFQVNGVYFQGDESEAKENYNNSEFANIDFDNFEEYCYEYCLLVEEDYTDINDDYLVLTDEEADKKAAEYIKESVWAFTAEFIVDHSKLPYEAVEMVQAFQEKYEDANKTILALIEDFDEFVSDAISADGRGHFMNSYDGHEHEVNIDGTYYYVYRMN